MDEAESENQELLWNEQECRDEPDLDRHHHTPAACAYYKFMAKLGHSITQVLKTVQIALFSRRNL